MNGFLLTFYIGIAGLVGVITRYLFNFWSLTIKSIIISTLIVNIVGSFLIGIMWSLREQQIITQEWYLIIAAGFLGGLTTFSGFTLNLALLDNTIVLLLYLITAPILGLLAVKLGIRLTQN